jgi:transposase
MFIRRANTRTTASGEHYFSYRLVDTFRLSDRVRQRTLLNLGSGFCVPQEHWPVLCQRIEHIVRGQHEALLPLEPALEREAQHIAAAVLSKYAGTNLLLSPKPGQENAAEDASKQDAPKGPDMRCVEVDSLQLMDSRSVGGEAVALSALQRAGLQEKFQGLGFNTRQISAAIGNIVGRMVQPGSELSTYGWLQEHSALGELLGCDYTQLSLVSLYRASDLLWKHHETIETFLYERHRVLFGVEETITLFDLTNTFFEGTGQYCAHAAYGHSKEKRSDCPLVTLALVLDGSGFSRRSRIYPGNVSEPGTLQQMIEQLRTPQESSDAAVPAGESDTPSQLPLPLSRQPTIVMDAGIASEENVRWLQEQGYPYIVVSRKHERQFDEGQAVVVKADEHDAVRAMRVEREDGEVELYCHSKGREAKESAIEQRFAQRFEQALQYLAEGLDKPHRLKSAKKVCEKIGRLRQQYARVAKNYEITTEHDDSGKRAVALHYRRIERTAEAGVPQGVYCLRSNHRDWDAARLWNTYTLLTDLEAVFRSLKSELGMRPVYHQKTHRVEGHIFITLLAYNLVHQIRLTLKGQGIHDSWETIRTTMSTQMRTTVSMRAEGGEQIHVRKSSCPSGLQQRLLSALKLPWNPGKTQKTIVTP